MNIMLIDGIHCSRYRCSYSLQSMGHLHDDKKKKKTVAMYMYVLQMSSIHNVMVDFLKTKHKLNF